MPQHLIRQSTHSNVAMIALSPCGRYLAVSKPVCIAVIGFGRQGWERSRDQSPILSLTWSQEGTHLLLETQEELSIFNATSGALIRTRKEGSPVRLGSDRVQEAERSDGMKAVIGPGGVGLYRSGGEEPFQTIPREGVQSVGFTPDGRLFLHDAKQWLLFYG